MASSARASLRNAYRDAAAGLGRSVPTLLVTSVSAMILGAAGDELLLSGNEVSTPFIGKTRYEVFMLLAPASILLLKIYADLQFLHYRRIEAIVERHRISRPLTLSARHNPALRWAAFVALHLLPPFSIAFLGYYASAIYPVIAVCLYALAILVLGWSIGVLVYRRGRETAGYVIGVSALAFCGSVYAGYDPEQSVICERRYEGYLSKQMIPFLRGVELIRTDLSEANVSKKNMTCGVLADTKGDDADFRESLFWSGSIHGADFAGSELAHAEFSSADLGRVIFDGANAFSAVFVSAIIGRSSFVGAKLTGTKFSSAEILETDFTEAKFGNASLNDSYFFKVDFSGSQLERTEFLNSNLSSVKFDHALLNRTIFSGAFFEDVSFKSTKIGCAQFFGIKAGTPLDWSEVELSELRRVDLDEASRDSLRESVLLPKGFNFEELGEAYQAECSR